LPWVYDEAISAHRLMRAIAVLALVYLISAKLGLKLALVNQYATAVWPPTGIALAALLLWATGSGRAS
jgi:integral membrane sensor domain MASE1